MKQPVLKFYNRYNNLLWAILFFSFIGYHINLHLKKISNDDFISSLVVFFLLLVVLGLFKVRNNFLSKGIILLDKISLVLIIGYILFLIIGTFEELSYSYNINTIFKVLFILEVILRISILNIKKFFSDTINIIDLILLVVSFIPGYEMLRATRLFTLILKRPEMAKMLEALKLSSQESKDWIIILLMGTVILSLFLQSKLSINYPHYWGDFFISLKTLGTLLFSLNDSNLFESVYGNYTVRITLVLYFSLFIPFIFTMIGTALMAARNKLNIEIKEPEKVRKSIWERRFENKKRRR
jgi:hypothetical protein